jgi:ribosomal-protein-alanine N-acetyltransferase
MEAKTKRLRKEPGIRACRAEDVGDISNILQQSPEAAAWSAESLRKSLSWPGVLALISEEEGKTTGFILGRHSAGEGEILNLAVTPARRRKGGGGALLKAALEEFSARGVSRVFLEVRESNEAAIAFYGKHGFSKTGTRPGYYREPNEAAIVMQKKKFIA